MNIPVSYLIDFAPILIGIILFYTIRSVKLSKTNIRIYGLRQRRSTSEVGKNEGLPLKINSGDNSLETNPYITPIIINYTPTLLNRRTFWEGHILESDKARENAFRKIITHTLITNGIRHKTKDRVHLGLSKFGMLDLKHADTSLKLPLHHGFDSLSIFCSGNGETMPELLHYGKVSGTLTWYLLESKLSALKFKASA